MRKHKRNYGIYHFDTFDNEAFLVNEADSLNEATKKVLKRYEGRLSINGADLVDIVDKQGNIIKSFSVT